jgi:hypothetical protein
MCSPHIRRGPTAEQQGGALESVLEILPASVARELFRFIVLEIWAYWRKQRRERKYEADMAAFRAGKGNLKRPVSDDAR